MAGKYKTKCAHCKARLYVDIRIREEDLKISCNACYMRINNLDGITCTLLTEGTIKYASRDEVLEAYDYVADKYYDVLKKLADE